MPNSWRQNDELTTSFLGQNNVPVDNSVANYIYKFERTSYYALSSRY